MNNPADELAETLRDLTSAIVAAYVGHNSISVADLPGLIVQTHASLKSLGQPVPVAMAEEAQKPAVPIRKSVTPDYLICLEDGKKFKTLKRHIGNVFNLTPDQYRAKWKLPADYPMVAPNYTATRSALAKDLGLGRKAPEAEPAPKRRRQVAVAA
jgi:predicted transcriptional regulator